jgi:hypothetical protein
VDSNALIIFKTDIAAQMSLIRQTAELLEQRAVGLTLEDEVRMESVAYQIHNLYNATEDLLKRCIAPF